MLTSTAAVVSMGFLFVETTLAARLISIDAFGSYVLVVAVVNFLMMAVDFGAKTAVTQLIAGDGGVGRIALVNSAIFFRLAVIAGVSAVIWLPRELLSLLDPAGDVAPHLWQIPGMLLVASLDQLLFGMLQGCQAYRSLATAQVLRSTLRLALTAVVLGPLGLGVTGLLYSWTLSFGASAAYQYWMLPVPKRWVFERPVLGRLLRFGAPLQFAGLLWFLFGRVQTLLLGAWAGPTSVAYFAVASRIPEALQQVAESYMAVYFPRMTALLAAGRREHASGMLNTSLRLVSFGAAAVALGGVLFSPWITELLFSARYAASAPAFAILMLTLHMVLVVNLLGYTLTSAGHPQRSLIVDSIRTGVLVLGSLLLIPLFGFMGAAYARLISSYVGSPVVVRLVRRDYPGMVIPQCLRQTAVLLFCAGLGWWADALVGKLAVGALFLILSATLGSLSSADLALVLPLGQLRGASSTRTGEGY
ncbi:MAG: oligosaccharide flippase family protein [Chloroflexota bacterium]|nr:oligosaccharide flippase family protein [Chloroflexota bacterium]